MRTPASGPSNGMPPAISAADAPMMEMTSGWCTWSAERTVAMTWTSLRNPSANDERIGRSIMRAVRVAFSEGRDSRLMNPPGSLPAAYMRSSKSTVSGKKSRSLGCFWAVAVTSTIESPWRTTTAPPACLASSPVSSTYSLPYSSNVSTILGMVLFPVPLPWRPMRLAASRAPVSVRSRILFPHHVRVGASKRVAPMKKAGVALPPSWFPWVSSRECPAGR